jgi:CHAD domain.
MKKNSPKWLLQKNELLFILNKRFIIIYFKLQSVINEFDMEEIHSFRVEIKQLKSFLRLLKIDLKHPARLKFPKYLNKIYKFLGRIRVFQLQQQNISKAMNEIGLVIPLSYLNILNENAAKFQKKVKELAKDIKSINKGKADLERHSPHKLYYKTLERFVDSRMNAIRNLLLPEVPKEKSLHVIRKLLKDIQYNIPLMVKDLMKRPDSGNLLENRIKSATGLLGEFHDIRIALRLLDEELTKHHISGDEKILLEKIRNNWETEKENIKLRVYQE